MATFKDLRLRQVSESLARVAPLATVARPRGGWLRAIRTALGMSTRQLAERVGVGQSALSEAELRERDDAITLGTLRKVAAGLECDLVYALIPRSGSLEDVRERRARTIAERQVARVSHSMALENQAITAAERERQVEDRVRALLRGSRRQVWDDE
jgi:predicted DNA-binding mobile mystery protein A